MHNPNFSSGPCSKRPGWTPEVLKSAAIGRSHRSALGRKKLASAIDLTREVLGIPGDYLVGIVPASDTGAFELAMWNLLGPRPVTVLVWECFSETWAQDIKSQLKLDPLIRSAPYGELPDLEGIDWTGDVVFVANGTTSGVKIPHWDWIPADREGLSICDATSAVFAQPVEWGGVDVATFSWQKCLGGEGGHGMLVLSPRAVARIESYDPPWPLPKIFRIKAKGKVDRGIFAGDTINTPSMLCVEDYLDGLNWAREIGLEGLFARTDANLKVVEQWAAKTPWIEFLAKREDTRSNTSVCLVLSDRRFKELSRQDQDGLLKSLAGELDQREVAYDINSYRDAPPGLRFWCGPTIEPEDLERALAILAELSERKLAKVK